MVDQLTLSYVLNMKIKNTQCKYMALNGPENNTAILFANNYIIWLKDIRRKDDDPDYINFTIHRDNGLPAIIYVQNERYSKLWWLVDGFLTSDPYAFYKFDKSHNLYILSFARFCLINNFNFVIARENYGIISNTYIPSLYSIIHENNNIETFEKKDNNYILSTDSSCLDGITEVNEIIRNILS